MTNPPDILNKILARKREEIAERQIITPIDELHKQAEQADPTRGFVKAMQAKNRLRSSGGHRRN